MDQLRLAAACAAAVDTAVGCRMGSFWLRLPDPDLGALDEDDADTVRRSGPPRPKQRPSRSPTKNRALDRLGLFAYAEAECLDRLSLIDQVLAAPHPDDDVDALDTARWKIDGWLRHLRDPADRQG
jgi:hypothetical protein